MALPSFVPRPVLLLEDIEGLAAVERSSTPVYHDDDGGGVGLASEVVEVARSDERGRRDRRCAHASPSRSYLEIPRRSQGDSSNGSAPAALHSQFRQR